MEHPPDIVLDVFIDSGMRETPIHIVAILELDVADVAVDDEFEYTTEDFVTEHLRELSRLLHIDESCGGGFRATLIHPRQLLRERRGIDKFAPFLFSTDVLKRLRNREDDTPSLPIADSISQFPIFEEQHGELVGQVHGDEPVHAAITVHFREVEDVIQMNERQTGAVNVHLRIGKLEFGEENLTSREPGS
jgi:hypothetical protein